MSTHRPPRFETKFLVEGVGKYEATQFIKLTYGHFREIYSPRTINNIYFDTPSLKFLYDNISGIAKRKKIRVRWYGKQSGSSQATLEIKERSGLLGTKESYPLGEICDPTRMLPESWQKLFQKHDLPAELRSLLLRTEPVLYNSYHRTYFLDRSAKFRLTLDSALQAQSIRTGRHSLHQPGDRTVIFELKYALKDQLDAAEITNHLKFRQTRSSKYVMGMQSTSFAGQFIT